MFLTTLVYTCQIVEQAEACSPPPCLDSITAIVGQRGVCCCCCCCCCRLPRCHQSPPLRAVPVLHDNATSSPPQQVNARGSNAGSEDTPAECGTQGQRATRVHRVYFNWVLAPPAFIWGSLANGTICNAACKRISHRNYSHRCTRTIHARTQCRSPAQGVREVVVQQIVVVLDKLRSDAEVIVRLGV